MGSGVVEELQALGVGRGDLVALALVPAVGVAIATSAGGTFVAATDRDPFAVVNVVEDTLRPRWVMWSNATAIALVTAGVRIATAWDIAGVSRVLFGGWRADPARVWAQLHGLPLDAVPSVQPIDLFNQLAADASIWQGYLGV